METISNIEKEVFADLTFEIDTTAVTVKVIKATPKGKYVKAKVIAYYTFKRHVDGLQKIAAYVEGVKKAKQSRIDAKNELKNQIATARKNFVNPYFVGQLFYDSWGYDQTNIDFYQVVEVKPKSIVVREVAKHINTSKSGYDCGVCIACPDQFVSEPKTKVIQVRVWSGKARYDIEGMSPWDGTPKHVSWGR